MQILHFPDEETKAKKSRDLPKVTQPVSISRARTQWVTPDKSLVYLSGPTNTKL